MAGHKTCFSFYFRPPDHIQNGYVDEGYMSPRGRPPIQNGRQGMGANSISTTLPGYKIQP